MELGKYPRVVILGSAGFLGFHLAQYVIKHGATNLVIVDNFIRGKRDEDYAKLCDSPRVTHLTLDLTLEANLNGLFSKGDLVINCIALNGTQNFYSRPFEVLKNSAIPAIHIPFHAAQSSVGRYLYFGSSESYAGGVNLGVVNIPTPEQVPLVIEDVTNVRWSYAIAKTIGESACFAAASEFDLVFQVLRIHNIYGPRMGHEHVIPDLIRKFMAGSFGVHGMAETRSFLYIDDMLHYFVDILNSDSHLNQVINIGSENEVDINHVALLISKALGIDAKTHEIGSFPGSVSRRSPDLSKLKTIAKNFSETSLEIGIAKTIEWYILNEK